MHLLSSLLTLLPCLICICRSDGIILTPDASKTGPTRGLVYITGAKIYPSQYVALCQTLIDLSPEPLYIAIPSFTLPFATLPEFASLLPTALANLRSAGLSTNSSVFIAGHSVGGAVAQDFGGTYQHNYTTLYPDWVFAGQILQAAVIVHKWRDPGTQLVTNYSIPTLTLGGEMDGNMRISRIIQQYYIQLMKNATKPSTFVSNETLLNLPVIVINGLSHMQYATGDPPPNVLDSDLIPEISDTEARTTIVKHMLCWMSLQLGTSFCSFDTLYKAITNSKSLTDPFIAAFQAEGSYWFKNPCDCDPLICHSTPTCQAGAPYMDDALYAVNDWLPQEIMCGFMFNESIKVTQVNTDSFHPTYQIDPVHYANIWNTCDGLNDAGCVLNTSTVSQNIYPIFADDEIDSGGKTTSAIEMRHKMKSRESCFEAIGAPFKPVEDFEICGKINMYAIEWAFKYAPNRTLARFQAFGEALRTGADIMSTTGTGWTYAALHEERQCDNATNRVYTEVVSNYLYLKTLKMGCKFKPESECGVHYCKVLSPAHVMEWLYTDGLRYNLSIANNTNTMNITCL